MNTFAAIMLAVCCLTAEPAENVLSPPEIQRFVGQLNHKRFAVRAVAAQKLSTLQHIPAALKEAANSDDPELKVQAREIIERIQGVLKAKQLQAMLSDLKKVDLSILIDAMTQNPASNDIDKKWKVIESLTQALTKQSVKLHGRDLKVNKHDFKNLRQNTSFRDSFNSNAKFLIRNVSVDRISFITKAVVVSNQSLPKCSHVSGSLVILNGNLEQAAFIKNSIVLVKGDIGSVSFVNESIVLCTGRIEKISSVKESLIHSKGEMGRLVMLHDSTVICETGELKTSICDNSKIYAAKTSIDFNGPRNRGSTFHRLNEESKVLGPLRMLNWGQEKTSDAKK